MGRIIIVGATVEGALKSIALIDLARRPQSQVHGSKKSWALAIAFVNSAGVLPIVYFVRGRRCERSMAAHHDLHG